MKKEPQALTVPQNATTRMQELMRKQAAEGAEKPETKQSGGNEGMREPSQEDAREGGREGVIQPVREASLPEGSERVSEDWREGVREAAREGGGDAPGRTTRLNADLDEALHIRLRTHCMEQRITLKQLLPALLAAYLAEGK